MARLASDERGSLTVEFALMGLVMLGLLIGALDVGRLFWIRTSLQFSAEETGRWVLSHPTASNAQIVAKAASHLADSGAGGAPVTVGRTFAADGTEFVAIRIADAMPLGQGLVPLPPVEIVGRVQVPLAH